MRIAVGADHAGYALKNEIAATLRADQHEVVDFGTDSPDSVDYPDLAKVVGAAVAGGEAERGILICGTGVGMAIAANKVAGVRAASCSDIFSATMARSHNDANVLALGARVVGSGLAQHLVRAFLTTPFAAGRHQRRVAKIAALEQGR